MIKPKNKNQLYQFTIDWDFFTPKSQTIIKGELPSNNLNSF